MSSCFKYQFCVGCEHITNHECPSRGDPYDEDKCPRHARFKEMENGKDH